MTSRLSPVNLKRNNWYDGQQVTYEDLVDEQNRNVGIDAAGENNFFASGILEEFPSPPVIFDTDDLNSQQQALLDSYGFDGQNVYIGSNLTPSDAIKGVQLAVSITNARLDGAASTKVSIIGDTFGGELVHDDLTFEYNGTQVTRNRYINIRGILFNDFAGNLWGSYKFAAEADGYNLIGRCKITEAMAMEVSPDPIMFAQNAQPNQFWDDFKPASATDTLNTMLENTIGPDKSVSDMNIGLASVAQRELPYNDVTTRIGQKFLSNGNNIQKLSVLLSVKYNAAVPIADAYNWTGDVVLTLHELQTAVECPVTPTPDNAINFDPDPTIIGQVVLDEDDLKFQGVDLTDGYVHIVDFVFTGSNVSDPDRSPIEEEKYYVFTLGRSGDTTLGTLLIEEAADRVDNSHMAVYDGNDWVDIPESDMWFEIYGDYVKISDGIAYDDGIGVQVPRIAKDETNTDAPYVLGYQPYITVTRNAYNYILLEVADAFSDPEQDQRTGNQVFSRKAPDPTVSSITQSSLDTLVVTDPDPVLLARGRDQNSRGNPVEITGSQCGYPALAYGDTFNIIVPDADHIQNGLVGSFITIQHSGGAGCCGDGYSGRIITQTLYNDAYGDINGDGTIDNDDLTIITNWVSTYGSIDRTDPADMYLFEDGTIEITQFLRADVNGDGVVDNTDKDMIEDYINKNITSFTDGTNILSTFSRMELMLENKLNPLTTTLDLAPNINNSSCVSWTIDYIATWSPGQMEITDLRRLVVSTYAVPVSSTELSGRNDIFLPANVLIDGYLQNPDGTPYSIDFEVNQVNLEIPITDAYGNPTFLDGYSGILLFDNFVAESSSGTTAGGFSAMKYADGTYVLIGDFDGYKVKITASLQSIVNEYNVTMGGTVNDKIGMYYDPSTSLLSMYVDELYNDGYGTAPVEYHSNLLISLNMRVLVTVYLKRAGFRNEAVEITAAQMGNLLGI
jgi:hypothetical protein